MQALLTLTISSIKIFFRNKQALFFTFFSPLMIMVIFGLIGFDRVPQVDVGVALNAPPSASTQAFVNRLKDVSTLNVDIASEVELKAKLEEGDLAAVFVLPPDLIPAADASQAPDLSQTKTVTVFTNSSQQQNAAVAISMMNEILNRTALSMTNAGEMFAVEVQEVSTTQLDYLDFLLPGLIGMSMMQMAIFSVAFIFTNYREKGMLKRLLATPMRPAAFVGANVITRLIVSFIQTAIFIIVGITFLKATVIGSYWLIALIVVLGSLMFLGMGFAISGIAKTQESVPAIANLIAFPMLFLGGTFFPISSFPSWLQPIAELLPLTFLTNSLRAVMTEDAGLIAIMPDLLWMTAWAAVMVILANWLFSFEEKRQ